jgi:uncharacterized protein YpmB
MNKRALFLSVAITTFILVIVGGVFSIYRALASTGVPVAQVQPVSQAIAPEINVPIAVPTLQQVTPEQAAAIAAEYLGQEDIYAVESAMLESVTVYRVTFSSGYIVYVGLDGQILRAEKPQESITNDSSQHLPPPVITDDDDDEDEHELDDD